MIIHGRDRQFLLTVQASMDVAELCPDGDLGRIREALNVDGPQAKSLRFIAKFVAAMSRGYENDRKYGEPGYTPDPLTVEEVLSLPMSELIAVQTEAIKAFFDGMKTEIETQEVKENGKSPKKEEDATADN